MLPNDRSARGSPRKTSDSATGSPPCCTSSSAPPTQRHDRRDEHADLEQPPDELLDVVVADTRVDASLICEPRDALVQHLERHHDDDDGEELAGASVVVRRPRIRAPSSAPASTPSITGNASAGSM